jgi:DSBA-like thioredoxin domain.
VIDKQYQEIQCPAFSTFEKKPLELYYFIDPLCPECWALEPVIKKLLVEYGHYFTLTYVIGGNLSVIPSTLKRKPNGFGRAIRRECIDCGEPSELKTNLPPAHLVSCAIKAAELQGRRAGIRYLQKFREYYFINHEKIFDDEILLRCAEESGLDVAEFMRDLYSETTAHAFQCDLKIIREMEVTILPTIVFFNDHVEEDGIKVQGVYPYEVYTEVFTNVLGRHPVSHPLPPLDGILKYFHLLSSWEIACIYDWPVVDVEKKMQRLLLQNLAEKIQSPYGTFWRYIGSR